jgi:alkanesulfonate monooxygenase SsuD/methylene tetrahydromethanopterin reductase-like flavin-dependent oxidoreductase (luciferase family)
MRRFSISTGDHQIPPTFDLESDGSEGIPFAGSPDKVAEDIRTYEALGVTNLIFDFSGVASFRVSNPSAIIAMQEALALQVWPRV